MRVTDLKVWHRVRSLSWKEKERIIQWVFLMQEPQTHAKQCYNVIRLLYSQRLLPMKGVWYGMAGMEKAWLALGAISPHHGEHDIVHFGKSSGDGSTRSSSPAIGYYLNNVFEVEALSLPSGSQCSKLGNKSSACSSSGMFPSIKSVKQKQYER